MSDFDKNQPAVATSANARRKQILVGVLGAVLVAVLGFHFLKGSPEAAVASSNIDNPGETAAPAVRPASEEHRDLLNDPTAKLLQGNTTPDDELATPPHNPFKLSERFRPAPKAVVAKVDPAPVEYVPPQPVPQVQVIAASSLRIEAILRVGKKLQAVVNGSMVSIGMTVGDAKIVDIQTDHVVVRHKDWPDGPTTMAQLQARAKRPEKSEKSEKSE